MRPSRRESQGVPRDMEFGPVILLLEIIQFTHIENWTNEHKYLTTAEARGR